MPSEIARWSSGRSTWGATNGPLFFRPNGAARVPAANIRGFRFSMAEGHLFQTQLRAIVQVARLNDVRLPFPMVAGSRDFSRAAAAVDAVADEPGMARRTTHRGISSHWHEWHNHLEYEAVMRQAARQHEQVEQLMGPEDPGQSAGQCITLSTAPTL